MENSFYGCYDLNPAKTEFMIIGSRQRLSTFDNQNVEVCVNNKQINRVLKCKSLGLTIDENLTWKYHVDNITKKVSPGIGALKRMRDFITRETPIRVYQSLVEPYFSYYAPVWDGLGKKQSDKLQKVQSSVITRSSYDISSSSLLEEHNWESLSTKRLKQKATLMSNTVSFSSGRTFNFESCCFKRKYLSNYTSYGNRNCILRKRRTSTFQRYQFHFHHKFG
jgi:hypothetical protein